MFRYCDTELCCEKVPLSGLAAKFGTPLYVYSASAIRERYSEFDRAFAGVPHTICYSVKANANLSILKLLSDQDSGFDVVSGGELQRVLQSAPRAAERIVFSGVGKTAKEIDAALRAEILLINVESESELALLSRCAARMKKKARVALRINPDVPANTHPHISTGRYQHKFGVLGSEARRLYRHAAGEKWLEVVGISAHIGSQVMEVSPFRALSMYLADLTQELQGDGIRIRYLDVGGGLGIPYDSPESRAALVRRLSAYARAITAPLCKLDVHLLLEPGRIILGPAGVLLASVSYVKQQRRKQFLVIDAGMNDLIRPALYGAHHEIVPVKNIAERIAGLWTTSTGPQSSTGLRSIDSQCSAGLQTGCGEGVHALTPSRDLLTCDVVGPICETGDVFAHGLKLPQLREGSLLAILDAGAYGMSLASNYNSRQRAAEVLVEGGKARLIRRRELFSDLVRAERL